MQTIDEVLSRLTEIIDQCRKEQSTFGYFAALYRRMTQGVKDGIQQGAFEDPVRMARLDVIFANRYFDAYDAWKAGRPMTDSWAATFREAENGKLSLLQHLLLGMSTHINLDLGIAAAQSVPPGQMQSVEKDFNKINDLIFGFVNEVQEELARVWWPFRLLDRFLETADEGVANFSIVVARREAWRVAVELSPLSETDRATYIHELDRRIAVFNRVLAHPGTRLSFLLWLVRIGERGAVAEKIAILNSPSLTKT